VTATQRRRKIEVIRCNLMSGMGITQAVARGIWLTNVALDEYDVRGALLLGGYQAVVWDTLARPRDMRAYDPLIRDRALTIVYSHADWDHIWGTAGLPYSRARVIAHQLARERFGADVVTVLAEKQAAQPGRWDDVVLVPPTESFEDASSIDLGGLTLMLHHLPGHTPDCIVGFIPEQGVLLAGDTVETPCPVVPPDSPLADWIAELRRWADDDRVRLVIPAHGPQGGRELLRQNIAYLESLLDGNPIEPPGQLTTFYRDTHRQNMRWRPAGERVS
jgi:glyoxylase-like metal-dependent hydrolase (beta-lactamase superfamily II)